MRSSLQYMVAYNVTSQAQGQQISSQMTEYVDGTSKMRTDASMSGIESRTYVLGKEIYSCTSQQGSWVCLNMSTQQETGPTQAEGEISSNMSNYQIVADGTMQVAGVTATCFKVTGTDITYYRSCFSSEGVPLYVEVQGSSGGQAYSTEMVASSYSTSVPDSDFVLPAAATALPSIAGAVNGSAGANACSYCGYLTGSEKTQCLASCGG